MEMRKGAGEDLVKGLPWSQQLAPHLPPCKVFPSSSHHSFLTTWPTPLHLCAFWSAWHLSNSAVRHDRILMGCLIYCFTPYQSGTNQSTAFNAWKGLNEFKKKRRKGLGWRGEGETEREKRKRKHNCQQSTWDMTSWLICKEISWVFPPLTLLVFSCPYPRGEWSPTVSLVLFWFS